MKAGFVWPRRLPPKQALPRPFVPDVKSTPDFAALVGAKGWARLHPAIRRRFSNHAVRVCYSGDMHVRCNWLGSVFALCLLPFGQPLPLILPGRTARHFKAKVDVFPNAQGGVVWRRDFERGGESGAKAPLRIESVKQLAQSGGLIETVKGGRFGGIGMASRVYERGSALYFESVRYFIHAGKLRIGIPAWLSPGKTLVEHKDLGEGIRSSRFRFRLTMTHKWFGQCVYQSGDFTDPHGNEDCGPA